MTAPLYLLTPTGDRQAAFNLCARWLIAQDYPGPSVWVVVDDGQEPTRVPSKSALGASFSEVVVVRPHHTPNGALHTLGLNIQVGLKGVPVGAAVAVIEDDDYYAPGWLTKVVGMLATGAHMVGEAFARYYNVQNRTGMECENSQHASLCSTAFQGPGVEALRAACAGDGSFIDLGLWGNKRLTHHLDRDKTTRQVVGIKGMPGRKGIGMGHRPAPLPGFTDPSGDVLKKWIGADAAPYLAQRSTRT